MKFDYTGRHIEVTPALRSHVEEHFERLDHLFEDQAISAHIIIEVEKGRHRSEVIVKWRNEVLAAENPLRSVSVSELDPEMRPFPPSSPRKWLRGTHKPLRNRRKSSDSPIFL